jgi:hypothetical protein
LRLMFNIYLFKKNVYKIWVHEIIALRPGGVTICAIRLAGAGCEYAKIERGGEQLERPMSSSGL